MIPFNKPYLTGKETHYIYEAVNSGKISGNGIFTKKCQQFFEEKYGFKKTLLTTSCTDALEMAAILANIEPEEVNMPSYTFVSTATALGFVRQGAKIVFADICDNHPNIDANKIEALITPKTKAIVPVHYAGISCDMGKIMQIAHKHKLLVIGDAAQAIDSFCAFSDGTKKALETIGHSSDFSFHETKNIISGEGGMLGINDEKFVERSEIIWEKGTNRSQFFRGEINKYGWVDTGSSFLPSEIVAAFLLAQLENLDNIQAKRKQLWQLYYSLLEPLATKLHFSLPHFPGYASNNAHMFYVIFDKPEYRDKVLSVLKEHKILAVFHYLSLHSSDYYQNKHDGRDLPNSDKFTNCLLRLPLFYELKESDINFITTNLVNI